MLTGGCAATSGGVPEHYAVVADESFLIYKEAERAYKAGDYELAQKNYEDFTVKYPDDVLARIALFYLGRSQEELGHNDKAREVYSRIIEVYPGDFWAESAGRRLQTLNR
jgi:TolA-binding protein